MDLAANSDQAPEGNVLCALSFEKALKNVLDWLRQEQDTFRSRPSIRVPVEIALRSIVPSIPPLSPARTHEGTPTSTQPEHDLVSTPASVQAGSEHVEDDDRRDIEHTRVAGEKEVGFEQAGLDAGQEKLIKTESDALQTVGDGHDIQSSASPNRELVPATGPPNLKRMRQRPSSSKSQTSKRQRRSKVSLDADPLPADLIRRVGDIATFDDMVFLWELLQLLSRSTSSSKERIISQEESRSGPPWPSLQKLSRRQRLEKLWSCIGDSEKMERWATVLQRICQAEFFGQYLKERTWFNEWKEQRRRQRAGRQPPRNKTGEDVPPPSHPLAEYVDLCFPEGVEKNREKAKKKFENLVQTKEPWVKLGQRFGTAVFVVTSAALRDEHLRTLGKPQLEPFLDLIYDSIPSLEADLRGVSELLLYLVEHGQLPPYRLRLELFSKDQLELMRSTEWSLKELLEPCGPREREDPAIDSPRMDRSLNHCLEQDCRAASPPGLAVSAQPTYQPTVSLSSPYSPGSSEDAQGCTSVTATNLCKTVGALDIDVNLNFDNEALLEDGHILYPSTDDAFLRSPLEQINFESLFEHI